MTEAIAGASSAGPGGTQLLADSAMLLKNSGYRTQPVALPGGRELLLAENQYCILGLVQFQSAAELPAVEAAASGYLADRLTAKDAGPKRWDLYVILLSAASAGSDDYSETVTTIVYNTSHLRRIVRWDVTADAHVLARALQPFLPLPPPPDMHNASPITALIDVLPQFGVSSEAATLAMEQWRERAND